MSAKSATARTRRAVLPSLGKKREILPNLGKNGKRAAKSPVRAGTAAAGEKTASPAAERRRAAKILAALQKEYPDAGCELRHWKTPLELAIATILSAQCTDKRVNLVTPALFAKYRSAADWAASPDGVLEDEIRSTGFFRNKARNIRALAARLAADYGGELPGDFDVLVGLPGIGRKTANLLVATVFGQPGLVVDTHFIRLTNRLGFVRDLDDPVRIEFAMREIVPRERWTDWSHCMVFHGRRCCSARAPECGRCPVRSLCPSAK
jgi:endonuclease-3